jgi:hypothetical protein
MLSDKGISQGETPAEADTTTSPRSSLRLKAMAGPTGQSWQPRWLVSTFRSVTRLSALPGGRMAHGL